MTPSLVRLGPLKEGPVSYQNRRASFEALPTDFLRVRYSSYRTKHKLQDYQENTSKLPGLKPEELQWFLLW